MTARPPAPRPGHSAARWVLALACYGALTGLCGGCNPSPASVPSDSASTQFDSLFTPVAPTNVAQNEPGPGPATPAPGTTATPPPAPARPVNPQALDKIIEDNITMREEIRRLRLERENLIRLLRAMGENYDPVDPDQKAP